MLAIRSALFNILFYFFLIVLMVVALPTLAFGRKAALSVGHVWARISLELLKTMCGMTVEFRGLEHLPSEPCLIAAKHQSFLETFALFTQVHDAAYVLKQELIKIPLFGWYLSRAGQVALNRDNPTTAFRTLLKTSQAVLARGSSLIIFPEGTRQEPGTPPDYKEGVALLYQKSKAVCVPVALNTGVFWPRRQFLRYPGRVVIEFLPPIAPGLKSAAFMALLQERIETASARLIGEAVASK